MEFFKRVFEIWVRWGWKGVVGEGLGKGWEGVGGGVGEGAGEGFNWGWERVGEGLGRAWLSMIHKPGLKKTGIVL